MKANFCNNCGHAVEHRVPEGDHLPRAICPACQHVQYFNPRVIVGVIPEWEDGRILLCRRAIEPRHGLWTLPAGFMENGETTGEAAIRETLEEANARIAIGELYSMYNLPYINQVYLLFRAKLLDLDFSPGAESLEVDLFEEKNIPWDELAFRPVHFTLQRYFDDRKAGSFPFHMGDLAAPAQTIR